MSLSDAIRRLQSLARDAQTRREVRANDHVGPETPEKVAQSVEESMSSYRKVIDAFRDDFNEGGNKLPSFSDQERPGSLALFLGDRVGCQYAQLVEGNIQNFGFKILTPLTLKDAPAIASAILGAIGGALANEILTPLALAKSDVADREARLTGLNNAATLVQFAAFVNHMLLDLVPDLDAKKPRAGQAFADSMIKSLAKEVDAAADKIRADFPTEKATIN